MRVSIDKLRNDFNTIARLSRSEADHPTQYDDFLKRQIPLTHTSLLEVGCGLGGFTRSLAARGHRITAVDLSPEMIQTARMKTPPELGVNYLCGDLFSQDLPPQGFDGVISIATLHHMDLVAAIERMTSFIRPGGILVLHDLRADEGIVDHFLSVLGVAVRWWSWWTLKRPYETAEARAAWAEHGRFERYQTMEEVKRWSREFLPGSRAIRHIQWRYTVVWYKPSAVANPSTGGLNSAKTSSGCTSGY